MIPATLVLLGPAPKLAPAVTRAARWLPFVPAAQAAVALHHAAAGAAGADGDAQVCVAQWHATGPVRRVVRRASPWVKTAAGWRVAGAGYRRSARHQR